MTFLGPHVPSHDDGGEASRDPRNRGTGRWGGSQELGRGRLPVSLSLALWVLAERPGHACPGLPGHFCLFIQTASLGPAGQRPLAHLSLAPGQAGEWQLGSLMPTLLALLQMETEAQDGGGGGR